MLQEMILFLFFMTSDSTYPLSGILVDALRFPVMSTELSDNSMETSMIAGIFALPGALISGIPTYLFSKLQARHAVRLELKKTLLLEKMKCYNEFARLLSKGDTVIVDTDPFKNPVEFPAAYSDLPTLKEWLNSLCEYLDGNSIVIDQEVHDLFKPLNQKILEDIKIIKHTMNTKQEDISRDIGRAAKGSVNKMVLDVVHSTKKKIEEIWHFEKM